VSVRVVATVREIPPQPVARTAPASSRWRWVKHHVRQQPVATAAGLIVLLYAAGATFAPWVAPLDPNKGDLLLRMAPPAFMSGGAAERLLGADSLGRDLLSRIIWGARASLAIGLLSVLASALVGVGLGGLAAFYRGPLDGLISRVAEFLMAFPLLIFAIGVMTVLGPGFWVIILALTFKSWVEFFRLTRAEVLVEKSREYAEAARTIGASNSRIMGRHLLPNVAHTILVLATLRTGYFIIMEASLSFLGLGIQPPTPAWGTMVADGRGFMLDAWWIATFPGLALLLLVLALNLLGEGLRDVLDPRQKGVR
jgi:peptide/nickel transport system permease protein